MELVHQKKKEDEESKLHENFKIAPPVSSPEEKEKTKRGTTIIVMPTVTTDNVINPNVLQIAVHTKTG